MTRCDRCGEHPPCSCGLPIGGTPERSTVYDAGAPVSCAVRALGLVVRYDAERKPPGWTVALPGVARGDGSTPVEAAKALRKALDPAQRGGAVCAACTLTALAEPTVCWRPDAQAFLCADCAARRRGGAPVGTVLAVRCDAAVCEGCSLPIGREPSVSWRPDLGRYLCNACATERRGEAFVPHPRAPETRCPSCGGPTYYTTQTTTAGTVGRWRCMAPASTGCA